MSEKFLRIYKRFDVSAIKTQLLIYGDLSGQCANCQKFDVTLNDPVCPECRTEFKYVSFRNIKSHLPKMNKLSEQRPSVTFIDHGDYEKQVGASKAEDFFGK